VLELVKEALDQVALSVEFVLDGSLDLPVPLGRDVCLSAGLGDKIDDYLRVIATVGDEGFCRGQAIDQCRDSGLVRGLPRGQNQPDRQATLVDDGVDLGAQSAMRTADGVIFAPFLPPAACWCARMIELSIKCNDCGERAAKASKTRSHTPALAQRLNRL
jgi:hypothetical protein